ncbi:MAG TPA: hypothetical protein VGL13_09295 [Polyangiaceae bacterium]
MLMPWQRRQGSLVSKILLAGVAFTAAFIVVSSLPDLRRYLKIRAM